MLAQFAVEPLNGESHHVEVGALEACDSDEAYPFLDAIRASLVEGTVGLDVVKDFLVGELRKGDMADGGEGK